MRPGAEPPAATAPIGSRVLCGDAIGTLGSLPEGFAQTAITSPPYWGLRDYGVPPRVWGGEEGCRHRWAGAEPGRRADRREGPPARTGEWADWRSGAGRGGLDGGRFCDGCGAWRGCLGLEPEPEMYVEHLVAVMREVRRCLRPDGTLWLVLGDSHAARLRQSGDEYAGELSRSSRGVITEGRRPLPRGLKEKDLVGIPWRVALALQADGWWLRSDTIWHKPNAMPESVLDRPTRAHEYVFLLSPSVRYHYDAFAVREPDTGRRPGAGYVRPERLSHGGAEAPRGQGGEWVGGGGRNRRSVWSIPTTCFKGAHFATFPEDLVDVCLLAGTSPVACRSCGAPWRRVVSSRRLLPGVHELRGGWTEEGSQARSGRALRPTGKGHWRVRVERETVGWEPGCDHDAPGARCAVLDPFAGVATTGLAAARHGRDFVGVELSGAYARMARRRLREAATETVEARG
ncbi:MAG: site-specific DNA-methyltransferase [Solirubrobacterales bacterium]